MEDETLMFEISVSTRFINSKDKCEFEIPKEELEGVPEDEWEDYVWDHLGGKEKAFEMIEMNIKRK